MWVLFGSMMTSIVSRRKSTFPEENFLSKSNREKGIKRSKSPIGDYYQKTKKRMVFFDSLMQSLEKLVIDLFFVKLICLKGGDLYLDNI